MTTVRCRIRFSRHSAAIAGFTLTEVLVALGLFTIGMVGIVALFGAAGMTARQAMDTTDASVLLDSILEDLDAHFEARYLPVDYNAGGSERNVEGYPEALLTANNGAIPENPAQIAIPPGWPGFNDVQALTGRVSLKEPMTYTIYFEPLPNTVGPNSATPQCVLAHVTVYWTRNGKTLRLDAEKVILLPN